MVNKFSHLIWEIAKHDIKLIHYWDTFTQIIVV